MKYQLITKNQMTGRRKKIGKSIFSNETDATCWYTKKSKITEKKIENISEIQRVIRGIIQMIGWKKKKGNYKHSQNIERNYQ